ncbi:DUF6386 family protein [Chelatococcus reniformis]|uniref:Uncharacterized protein n=1 Tax=Chelatococcus reniformis TaxID=1494448 RepID=A0A916U2P3_9HYPH|nr:DUF6386 family protein [Chelatococcus reniformis]GGC54726.1 hypothetical protein GCM10010994_12080 [Chelatococcus reniformis]
MSSKTIRLGTDVATLVLFHPEDLAHRDSDPIAWYSYDFIYRKESASGRLVAFGTGADGGYTVRLTTGALTPREAAYACPPWDFPLIVRHGRVLLDNTDALPGQEQMTDPASSDDWYEVANGPYRVTVHPLEWAAEPDAVDNGKSSPAALPSYVVTFAPVTDIASIAVAHAPPDLRGRRDWTARMLPASDGDRAFTWPATAPEAAASLPVLVVEETVALLPGQQVRLPVAEAVAEVAFPSDRSARQQRSEMFVAAPSFRSNGFAALGRANGLSRMRDQARLGLQAKHVVRIVKGGQRQTLEPVAVVPIAKPDMACAPGAADALKEKLARYFEDNAAARERLRYAAFDLEQLAWLRSPEAITAWALMNLDWPFAERLETYASPAAVRMGRIERLLGAEPTAPRRPSLLDRLWRR